MSTDSDLTAQLAAAVRAVWEERHQDAGCPPSLRHGVPCEGTFTTCRYRKPAALVAYEQAQRQDKRICPGCDASLTQCQEWRKNGAVACCPDCKHPLCVSSEPGTINQAHVTPDGDRWPAFQPDRPCRVEGAGEPKRVFSCGCTDNGSFCVRPDHSTGEYGKPSGRSPQSKPVEGHRWRITFSYYVGPGYRLDDHVVPGESLEAALAGFHQHALALFGVGKFHTLSVALADDAVPRVE